MSEKDEGAAEVFSQPPPVPQSGRRRGCDDRRSGRSGRSCCRLRWHRGNDHHDRRSGDHHYRRGARPPLPPRARPLRSAPAPRWAARSRSASSRPLTGGSGLLRRARQVLRRPGEGSHRRRRRLRRRQEAPGQHHQSRTASPTRARAAQVTGDLINNDKVDIVTAASTPDTVAPVADQAEAGGTPCITNDCPWQPYVASRSQGDLDPGVQVDLPHLLGSGGRAGDLPRHVEPGAQQQGRRRHVPERRRRQRLAARLGTGLAAGRPHCRRAQPVPDRHRGLHQPDRPSSRRRAARSAWACSSRRTSPTSGSRPSSRAGSRSWPPTPRPCSSRSRSKLSGDIANGLTTEVWWTPSHPFTSSLLGETCQQFADEFTKRQRQRPVDSAAAALHRLRDGGGRSEAGHQRGRQRGDHRRPSRPPSSTPSAARSTSRLRSSGATPPFQVGPCHIVENVYKTPLVGGQWRKGTTYPFELTIVSNAAAKDLGIPVQDKVQEYV